MSENAPKSTLEELLTILYGNIVQYVREDMLPNADKNFYSTRDFALGDTVSCSAEAALENCEQIRDFFPPGTPDSVFKNIDEVKDEIRRLDKLNHPKSAKFIWLVILVLLIGAAVYYVEHRYRFW